MDVTLAATHSSTASARRALWQGAALTAFSAVLFPRINAVIYDHEKIWQVDREAAVLIPVIVTVTLLLFGAIGGWALRGTETRAATAALAAAVLSLAGLLAFFVSAPIVLGGLAVTLGVVAGHRGRAGVAVGLGVVAFVAGAVVWFLGV